MVSIADAIARAGGDPRTKPSAEDPLAQQRNPLGIFDAISAVVDERIEQRMRGRTAAILDQIPDTQLVLELLARGWAVYRPQTPNPK